MPQHEDDVSVRHRLAVLRARYRLALVTALVVADLLAVFFWVQSEVYTAATVLSVRPRTAATVNEQSVPLLLSRYAAIGQSRQTLEQAARASGANVEALIDGTSVVNPPSTAILRVSVSLSDANQAASGANAVSKTIADAVGQDGFLVATIVEQAVPPKSSSGASAPLKILVAIIVGLVAAGGAALLAEALRPRIRTRRQLEKLTPNSVKLWAESSKVTNAQDIDRLRSILASPAIMVKSSGDMLLVCSPGHRANVLDFAWQLARRMALDDAPVLYVDLTGRLPPDAPSLPSMGPADSVVRDRASFDGLAVTVHSGSLSVLTTSGLPSPLSRDSPFGEPLQSLAERFEHIVIDGGPLLKGSAAAAAIAASCDAVLLVVVSGSRVDETVEAMALCDSVGVSKLLVCGVGFS